MTLRTWSFYDPTTGLFSGARFSSSSEDHLPAHIPTRFAAKEGRFDAHSQIVDLMTLEVVDYRPPLPDNDHEWDPVARRYALKPDVAARNQRRNAAQQQIEALEVKLFRPLSELADDPTNEAARSRVRSIREQIAAHRALLTAETDTSALAG